MEGIVEVFQIKDGSWDKIHEESNMVVHHGKVACADIFTHVPYELSDGSTPLASSVYQSVSNYTIQSITLGAGSKTMTKRDSRHAVTKANDMWGSNTKQYLDVSGKHYSLLPYRENWNFSSFGSFGLHKNSAKTAKPLQPKGVIPSPLLESKITRYGEIQVFSSEDEYGESLTFRKQKGQDYAILEMPIDLHLNTKYMLSLGIEGDLPVNLEIIRVDKISRENSLNVDLREQVWNYDKSRFVYEHEETLVESLGKLLYASSVIPGELTETLITTAFDRIDEGKRVELFDYKVRITAPKATNYEKGEVRIYDFRLESLENTILKNPNFDKIESLVSNTSFKDLTLYDSLSENNPANNAELKVMGVYQIGGWEHQTPLYSKGDPLWESLQASCLFGWISLDNVDSYGTLTTPPRTLDRDESNIGVSFNSCALEFDSSATAQLTKRFKFPKPWTDYYTQTGSRFEQGFLNDPYSHRTLTIKFDATPVSSTDVTPNAMMGVKVRCLNVTKNLHYNFVSGLGVVSKSWGGSGNPEHLGQGLPMDTSTTLQTNIKMPLEFYNDEFKLDIIGHAGNANGVRGKLTIRNLDIGQVQGWNIHEAVASGITVSSCAGSPVSGIHIITDQAQNPPANWYDLSSIQKQTFLSQTITGLDPFKAYSLIVEGKSNVGAGKVGVALVHKGFSNPYHFEYAKYFTVGPAYNAGNAYYQWFNPHPAYGAFASTMPGPQGPPVEPQADVDFEEHQKCVKWVCIDGVSSNPHYKFVDNTVPAFKFNNTYVSLPPGNFKFNMDMRHICDTTVASPYAYHFPVVLGLRVKSTNSEPGSTQESEAYWYNFNTRLFEKTSDRDPLTEMPSKYRTTILPGSHSPHHPGSTAYPEVAKTTSDIKFLKGDKEGWLQAQVSFDIRDGDFHSDASKQTNENEQHLEHTRWGTRDVEFIMYADSQVYPPAAADYGTYLPDADPLGTVYLKNVSLKGVAPFREPLNTYFVYRGDGDWVATSSLSSVEVNGELYSGPRAGHRPLRDASAGVNTWNELGKDFSTELGLNGSQKSLTIYGMDKFRPPDAWGLGYGNNTLENTGSVMASSMRMADIDSVYELLLFHTDGSNLEIHNVTLTDIATQFNDGPNIKSLKRWTSESSVTVPQLSSPGGWSTQFVHTSHPGSIDNITQNFPKVSVNVSGLQDTTNRIKVSSQAVWHGDFHDTIISYCDTLENFGMRNKQRYAFSFDYVNVAATAKEAIFLDSGKGDSIFFLSGTGSNTKWVPAPRNILSVATSATCWRDLDNFFTVGGEHVYDISRNYLSPEFVIPEKLKSIGDIKDIKIGVFVKTSPSNANMNTLVGDMRVYQTISSDVKENIIPIFPHEQDNSVQIPTDASTPGEYGHFQNAMEFETSATATTQLYHASSTTHIPSFEKAVHLGSYLPGSEMTFSAGTFGINGYAADGWNATTSSMYGVLNRFSVITPKGHILRNYNAGGDDWLHDSSGGLVVSGPINSVGDNKRVVKYALTLTRDEYNYLNYYSGGIETAGLWAIDGPASAKKQNNVYARPPYLTKETGTPYTESIYNLKDYIEPEWKLFAKKIFFAGGLKMSPESEYLTIIWSLKF